MGGAVGDCGTDSTRVGDKGLELELVASVVACIEMSGEVTASATGELAIVGGWLQAVALIAARAR